MNDREAIEEILYSNNLFQEIDEVFERKNTRFEKGKIVSLDLSGLDIYELPFEIFRQFENLEYLDLSYTKVTNLPSSLQEVELVLYETQFESTNLSAYFEVAASKEESHLEHVRNRQLRAHERFEREKPYFIKLLDQGKRCNWCEGSSFSIEKIRTESKYGFSNFYFTALICKTCRNVELFKDFSMFG